MVIALEALNHIARTTLPLVDLPVGSHRVDEMRATILDGDSITVTVEHLRKQLDAVRIVLDSIAGYDTKRLQLST